MNLHRDDSGAVAVVVAVMMVALLGVAAIVIDAGALYAERRQLQTAADAAALAGVQELPAQPAGAVAAASQYAAMNTTRADQLSFEIRSTWAPNDTIVAVVQESALELHFARLLGIDSAPVAATATAMIGSPRTYGSGVMPFGIMANGTTSSPYGYATGGSIPLVVENGEQTQGNWHYVDLTPWTPSENNTKGVISNGGTTEPLSIGTIITPQTGSVMNPNFAALTHYVSDTCSPHDVSALVYDAERSVYEPTHVLDGTHCNRLIVCPVITMTEGDPFDWDSATGASIDAQIVGFVNMLITNNPEASDGCLWSTFVQVVPDDVLTPGAYIEYGGVMTWLES